MKKYFKKIWPVAAVVGLFLAVGVSMTTVFAEEVAEIVTPTGFQAILTIIPLVLVLVLLFMKVDMIIAGLISAVLAMIIGKISIADANAEVLQAIPTMLTITVPIINSAVAMAVFKAGSYTAALEWVKRLTKGKAEYVSAFIVLLAAAATYMSGVGGGSAMVIAPLAFAAVGAVPELIAGMSIAIAASFTTSPASLETSIVNQLSGIEIPTYVSAMRPYWALFVVIGIVLAFYGTKRRKIGFKEAEDKEYVTMKNNELIVYTIPAIFLLFAVIGGPVINNLLDLPIFTPINYMIVTLFLIFVCTKSTLNEAFSSVVDGSSYILTRLFQVGIFLGFINIIAKTGTFGVMANFAASAPTALLVPATVLVGFAIGVPAGAYVGSVLTLILPIAISLGFSPLAIGFVTMGVGMGSQVSFVNITIQALGSGFRLQTLDIIKGNAKWVGAATVLLILISFMA